MMRGLGKKCSRGVLKQWVYIREGGLGIRIVRGECVFGIVSILCVTSSIGVCFLVFVPPFLPIFCSFFPHFYPFFAPFVTYFGVVKIKKG